MFFTCFNKIYWAIHEILHNSQIQTDMGKHVIASLWLLTVARNCPKCFHCPNSVLATRNESLSHAKSGKVARRGCHESSRTGVESQKEDGPGVTGQENLPASGLVLFLCHLLPISPLCQCWLLPATNITSHQGQGSTEKVSSPTADWPGWLQLATCGQWASWCTWCDAHCSERPHGTPGQRQWEWRK